MNNVPVLELLINSLNRASRSPAFFMLLFIYTGLAVVSFVPIDNIEAIYSEGF